MINKRFIRNCRYVFRQFGVEKMTKIHYQWSDIWLLQSIILGGGKKGASLYDMIRTGDALNHAIFSNDELESGLARLTAGEFIVEKGKRFFPTEKANEMYRKADIKGGSIYTVRERLEKRLKASPYDPKQKYPNPKNNLNYPGFSSKATVEAIEKWHYEARKLMKKK